MAEGIAISEGRRRAAVELASRSQVSLRRTARRYSLCSQDAEDAYQRGLEILLTKAPTDDHAQLRPWLHTVIKHEALAIRRARERLLGPEATPPQSTPGPDESAPERERARQTAEALGYLKQSEIQCMLLKALGYSYAEIGQRTGYTRTKVNRSLTEGRKHFFDRFAQIETGASCDQFETLLDAQFAGARSAPDEERLRSHLRSCSVCRAALRRRRATALRSMELLSPVALLPALRGGWWARLHDSVTGPASAKWQQATELVTAHKTAAVVASTAALAGGAAVEQREALVHPVARHVQARQAEAPKQEQAKGPHLPPAVEPAPVEASEPPRPRAQEEAKPRPSEFAIEAQAAAAGPAVTPDRDTRPAAAEPKDNQRTKEFMP